MVIHMRKKLFIAASSLIAILTIVTAFSLSRIKKSPINTNAEAATKTAQRFTESGRTVYVYAQKKNLHSKRKIPLILYLNSTGGDPRKEPISTGWAKLAKEKNFIVVSPEYDNAATYSEVPFFMKIVKAAKKRYNIDNRRIYVLGFSNGGASAVVLTSTHPKTFAGIAAYGWMVDLERNQGYQMPFQVIAGSHEATEYDSNNNPMVRIDERHAIRDLLIMDKMITSNTQPNYKKVPYWGYQPDQRFSRNVAGTKWTINNYMKKGYRYPFAQFILIAGAKHVPHRSEASYSWNFLRHFYRNSQGMIIEK